MLEWIKARFESIHTRGSVLIPRSANGHSQTISELKRVLIQGNVEAVLIPWLPILDILRAHILIFGHLISGPLKTSTVARCSLVSTALTLLNMSNQSIFLGTPISAVANFRQLVC